MLHFGNASPKPRDRKRTDETLNSSNMTMTCAIVPKIGDFGTSKWPQLANSTGLATYTTASSESTQMSYAWAAPEVKFGYIAVGVSLGLMCHRFRETTRNEPV